MKITVAALALFAGASAAASQSALVVCADPNNLPFSDRAKHGFENKIIALVAKDLGRPIDYVWWAQRRGYVRNTLDDSKCDVWPGMASGVQLAATSHPYYRSTYVFLTRESASFGHLTLDDPRLKDAAIGVQMIGNDATNTPPAHAIANRGIVANVRGYMVFGDYGRSNPSAAIVDAIADRQIDVALVWGPLAGYFAHLSATPLRIEPVTPAGDTRWPMSFDISMGVKRGDPALLALINASLEHEKPRIDAILNAYHVPLDSHGAAR